MADLHRKLTNEELAQRMAGFKPTTAEYILCQHEFARRLHEARSAPPQSDGTHMKLFVSHSSKDATLAGALVELLKAALGLAPQEIRCTSVDGHRLPAGAKTDPVLQREIRDAEAFIGVITAASIESAYVLFELGARWGADKHLTPLLGGGADSSYLRGPLSGYNALRCDSVSQLNQLIEDIGAAIGKAPHPASTFQGYIQQVISASQQRPAEPESRGAVTPKLLTDEESDILMRLSVHEEPLDAREIAKNVTLSVTECKYFLNRLVREKFVMEVFEIGEPRTYTLDERGRTFLVEVGLA
jgi:hypothetical protein